MDLKSYSRWYGYSRVRDQMYLASDTSWAPWYVVHSDNKRRARLNVLSHILSKIPHEELPRSKSNCRNGRNAATTKTPITRSGSYPRCSEEGR
jgi:hypothetical protein